MPKQTADSSKRKKRSARQATEPAPAVEPPALDEDRVDDLNSTAAVESAELDGEDVFPEGGHLPALDVTESDAAFDTPLEGSGTEIVPVDPLQRYLAEIRHLPVLTREEEHDLAVRYFQNSDQRAAYKLVLANLRLVVMIAREYQRNVQNVLDLVQEGNIGLLEAVKQYDPFRGIRFPSYAVYWIRAYMLRYLINNLRLVKIGTTQAQRKLFFNLQKEKDRLEAEGFVPEAKLLADRLKVKESEVIEMEQRLALPDLSVDATVRGTDDSADLHGILPDTAENAEQLVVREQFSEALREAVEKFKSELDAKEKAIIDRRLFTEDPATLQQVADEFGLSRERIRQIENRLKDRLKVYLRETLNLGEEGEVDIGLE
ncbi:MAG: RNA polymerase factor sigma-32 [Bdellovibrionota bacterium]